MMIAIVVGVVSLALYSFGLGALAYAWGRSSRGPQCQCWMNDPIALTVDPKGEPDLTECSLEEASAAMNQLYRTR